MKHFIFCAVFLLACTFSINAQSSLQTMKVAGTCGMCKKKIEEAAIKSGATKADWDKKSKMLQIAYDPTNVSEDQIKKSIADAGYDNETYKATDAAYNQLHECCKYDRSGKTDSIKSSCNENEKCKSKKKCCKKEDDKKCHPQHAQASCTKDKETKRKGCCKEH